MTTDKDTAVKDTTKGMTRIRPVRVEASKTKFSVSPSEASDEDKLLPSDDTLESIRELERGDGFHYASLGELWADLDS